MKLRRFPLALLLCLLAVAPALAIEYQEPEATPPKAIQPLVSPAEEQTDLSTPSLQNRSFGTRKERRDPFRQDYRMERTILPSDCLPGYTYGLIGGRSACLRCPANTAMLQTGGMQVCVVCPAGYQGKIWRKGFLCLKCPPGGKVKEVKGRLKCLKCPPGYMLGENYQGTTCVQY